jgi:hypothetical protein
MIKLKLSQPQNVMTRLINKHVLTNPVYLSPTGLIVNPNDLEATVKVINQMDLKYKVES